MEITIFEDKKMKILATLFLAVAWFTGMDMIENTAEAKIVTITPQKEREFAKASYEDRSTQEGLEETSADSPLRRIQDKLVSYNPDKLNYNDGKHDRWLFPVGIATGTPNYEGDSCGGYTYVEKSFEDRLVGYPDYDIVRYSAVAALLAHEFGHFVNKDTLSWVKGYPKSAQRDDEFGADQMGMQLLDAVPEYSMGSMINYASGFQGIYPTADDDLKFIEDWSYGRVKFLQVGHGYCIFSVDGEMLTVRQSHTIGDSADAKSYERSLYLAGQIASCIHHGIWKKENIAYNRESHFFPGGRDNKTTLAVWADSACTGAPVKILGTFDIDPDNPKENRNEFEEWEVDYFNFIKNWPKE